MKTILKLEELSMTIVALYMLTFHSLGLSAWLWTLLFFMPDIGMLGYVFNTRIGAFTYNLFHHKGIAIALGMIGHFSHSEVMTAIGILLFAHASFDRIFGYGLKYADNFASTHLGRIGRAQ